MPTFLKRILKQSHGNVIWNLYVPSDGQAVSWEESRAITQTMNVTSTLTRTWRCNVTAASVRGRTQCNFHLTQHLAWQHIPNTAQPLYSRRWHMMQGILTRILRTKFHILSHRKFQAKLPASWIMYWLKLRVYLKSTGTFGSQNGYHARFLYDVPLYTQVHMETAS